MAYMGTGRENEIERSTSATGSYHFILSVFFFSSVYTDLKGSLIYV